MEQELWKERTLMLTAKEIEVVDEVLERLTKINKVHCWYDLPVEIHRMIIRGYFDRKHKVRDTAAAVQKIHEFRKNYDIENIFKTRLDSHDLYHEAWPSYVAGEDEWGHWIVFEKVGDWNLDLLDQIEFKKLLQYRAQHLEALMEIKRRVSLRMGCRVSRYIQILDLQGLSYNKHMSAKRRSFIKPIFGLQGDIYPETLWKMFCINVHYSFNLIWRIIRPLLDDTVVQKISLVRNKKEILPAMMSCSIPIESIPEECGGESRLIRMSDIVDELIENPDSMEEFTTNRMPGPQPPNTLDIIKESPAYPDTVRKSIFEEYSRESAADTEKMFSLNDDDEVIMQGYLYKKGNINKSWKKRYFFLVNSYLYYFQKGSDDTRGKFKGKIDLSNVTRARASLSDAGLAAFEFDIITPYRTFHLKVDGGNDEDKLSLMLHWIDQINVAAEEKQCSLQVRKENEKSIRNGYLSKRGFFNSAFKRRYFLLTNQHLYYYTDDHTSVGATLKGKIDLEVIEGIEDNAGSEHCFSIHTPFRVYCLKATNEGSKREWIKDISKAVEAEKQARREGEKILLAAGVDVRHSSRIVTDIPSMDIKDVRKSIQMDMVAESPSETQDKVSPHTWRDKFDLLSFSENIISASRDFLQTAREMNVLVNPATGEADNIPSQDDMMKTVRGRVLRMFATSFGREKMKSRRMNEKEIKNQLQEADAISEDIDDLI